MSNSDRAIPKLSANEHERHWANGVKVLAACAALACLTLLPLHAHAAGKSDLDYQYKKWWAWAEVGGFYDSEYESEVEVELFFPIAQSNDALLFLDIEGELFGNGMQDGAVALGYREMFSNGWNLGVWAGPEVRRGRGGDRFWRFDAGLELLHPDYDLRFNTYMPVTNTQNLGGSFTSITALPPELILDDDQIYILHVLTEFTRSDDLEIPLWGFDGEVGARVPLEMAGLDPNNAELRLYGGGFYFGASQAVEEIMGPKARAELRFYDVIPELTGSRLTAEYNFSYDDVRGTRHKLGARFRIPFSGDRRSVIAAAPGSKNLALGPAQPLTRQERRMLDGLEREDIFSTVRPGDERTETTELREQVGDYLTGVVFDRVAYVDPGEDLSDVSAAQGDYTLIIVNGTIVTNETENIQGFQTVQGGQSTIPVFGVESGLVFDFTAPGAEAFIDSTADGDALNLLGDHTHIAGLDINGNGTNGHGINVGSDKNADPIPPGTWNIVIDQTDIHDVGGDGVHMGDNNAHVLIFNDTDIFAGGSSAIGTGSDGIEMGNNNQDVLVLGVDIWDFDTDGINMGDDNTDVTIFETTLTDIGLVSSGGHAGIGMGNGNEVVIGETTITNVGLDPDSFPTAGIDIVDNNRVLIGNTTISNVVSGSGININDENEVAIDNITISDIELNGINAENGNTLTVANSSISDIHRDSGINLEDGNTATIANTNITNTAIDGIVAFDFNIVDISDVTMLDIGGEGIRVSLANFATITDTSMTNVGHNGVDIGLHNVVRMSGVSITNAGISNNGRWSSVIRIARRNRVWISDSTITDAPNDGISMGDNNWLEMDNVTFAGTFGDGFGDRVIQFTGSSNWLFGSTGNRFIGTLGHPAVEFCRNLGTQLGTISFDVGPQLSCP